MISRRDLLNIGLLFLLNPLFYALPYTVTGFLPDSAAYLTLAENIIRNGKLYLEGWGHIDSGLILPPLYPFVAALFSPIAGGILPAAQYVSTISMLLVSVFLYLLVSRLSRPSVGFAVTAATQLNFLTLSYGTIVLSESLFMLLLVGAILMSAKYFQNPLPDRLLGIALGLVSAMMFLTRQIGIFFVLALLVVVILYAISKRKSVIRHAIFKFLWPTVGFLCLFLPFAVIVTIQTEGLGGPLTQYFRMGLYGVEAPPGFSAPVKSGQRDHDSILLERRENRRLLADSSEMYATLLPKNKDATPRLRIRSPSETVVNVHRNFIHLRDRIGTLSTWLFVLLSATPLLIKTTTPRLYRGLIPIFSCCYIIFVSLITGNVSRYMEVLFPIMYAHIGIELWQLSTRLPIREGFGSKERFLTTLLLFVGLVFLTPKLFYQARDYFPKGSHLPLDTCRHTIREKAPIFSLHPMHAYFLGATFRVLPNDNLQKTLKYARNTGVGTIVLGYQHMIAELEGYTYATWLQNIPKTLQDYEQEIRLLCNVEDGQALVIRLNSPENVNRKPTTNVR